MKGYSYQEVETREELVDRTKGIFRDASFEITAEDRRSASLDFIAQREAQRLLIKVHLNIDAFKQSHSLEINLLATILSGTGLLVGERRNKVTKMEDLVIYERHGVPTINLSTLNYLLCHNAQLEVCAKRGGLYVQINPQKLKEAREQRQLSIQFLAEYLDKSPRTIYLYEKGLISPSKEDAEKLKVLFKDDTSFIEPIEVIRKQSPEKISEIIPDLLRSQKFRSPKNSLQEDVNEHLKNLGMNVLWMRSLPFDAMALVKDKQFTSYSPVIAGVSSDIVKDSVQRRIIITNKILSLLHSDSIWIHEDDDDSDTILLRANRIPFLSFEEFENIEALKELFKILRRKKTEYESRGSSV
ncbi:MAG: helix-turn-helix domain-containing protein [Promethearchaeota archaeon]